MTDLVPQSGGQSWDDVASRARYIADAFPQIGSDPSALWSMAQTPLDPIALGEQAYGISGARNADQVLKEIVTWPKSSQRAWWSKLTPAQQQGYYSLGYQVPSKDANRNIPGAGILGAAGPGVAGAWESLYRGGSYVIGGGLRLLTEVGELPVEAYSNIRTGDNLDQVVAMFGAIAAVAAVSVLSGGTLAAPAAGLFGGALAGGALGGAAATGIGLTAYVGSAVAGAWAAKAVTDTLQGNPSTWWNTFHWGNNLERNFLPGTIDRAVDAIGDDGAVLEFAKAIALEADSDEETVARVLEEFGGERFERPNDEVVRQTLIATVERLARRAGLTGTDRYSQTFQMGLTLVQDPEFLDAITILRHGKISPGRDLARLLHIDLDSGVGQLTSGMSDAAFWFVSDPILAGGKILGAERLLRWGIKASDQLHLANVVENRYARSASVRRAFTSMADGLNARSYEQFRYGTPSARHLWPTMVKWGNERQATERAADIGEWWTAGRVKEFFTEADGWRSLASGQGASYQYGFLQLPHISAPGQVAARARADIMEGLRNLADIPMDMSLGTGMAARVYEIAGDLGLDRDRLGNLVGLPGGDLVWANDSVAVVRGADGVPVLRKIIGGFAGGFNSLLTRVPSLDAVALAEVGTGGARRLDELQAFTELGRMMNVPAPVRKAYLEMMASAQSPEQLRSLTSHYFKTMFEAAGLNATESGRYLGQQFVDKLDQVYSLGRKDATLISQLSSWTAIPNIRELRKAALHQGVLQKMLNTVDAPVVDKYVMGIWKPAVLLRIGFATRAIGDELLGWLAREGFYGLTAGKLATMVEAPGDLVPHAQKIQNLWDALQSAPLPSSWANHGLRPGLRNMGVPSPEEALKLQWLHSYSRQLKKIFRQGVQESLPSWMAPKSKVGRWLGREHTMRSLVYSGIPTEYRRAAAIWTRNPALRAAVMRELTAGRMQNGASRITGAPRDLVINPRDSTELEMQLDLAGMTAADIVNVRGMWNTVSEANPTFRQDAYNLADFTLANDPMGQTVISTAHEFVDPLLWGQLEAAWGDQVEGAVQHMARILANWTDTDKPIPAHWQDALSVLLHFSDDASRNWASLAQKHRAMMRPGADDPFRYLVDTMMAGRLPDKSGLERVRFLQDVQDPSFQAILPLLAPLLGSDSLQARNWTNYLIRQRGEYALRRDWTMDELRQTLKTRFSRLAAEDATVAEKIRTMAGSTGETRGTAQKIARLPHAGEHMGFAPVLTDADWVRLRQLGPEVFNPADFPMDEDVREVIIYAIHNPKALASFQAHPNGDTPGRVMTRFTTLDLDLAKRVSATIRRITGSTDANLPLVAQMVMPGSAGRFVKEFSWATPHHGTRSNWWEVEDGFTPHYLLSSDAETWMTRPDGSRVLIPGVGMDVAVDELLTQQVEAMLEQLYTRTRVRNDFSDAPRIVSQEPVDPSNSDVPGSIVVADEDFKTEGFDVEMGEETVKVRYQLADPTTAGTSTGPLDISYDDFGEMTIGVDPDRLARDWNDGQGARFSTLSGTATRTVTPDQVAQDLRPPVARWVETGWNRRVIEVDPSTWDEIIDEAPALITASLEVRDKLKKGDLWHHGEEVLRDTDRNLGQVGSIRLEAPESALVHVQNFQDFNKVREEIQEAAGLGVHLLVLDEPVYTPQFVRWLDGQRIDYTLVTQSAGQYVDRLASPMLVDDVPIVRTTSVDSGNTDAVAFARMDDDGNVEIVLNEDFLREEYNFTQANVDPDFSVWSWDTWQDTSSSDMFNLDGFYQMNGTTPFQWRAYWRGRPYEEYERFVIEHERGHHALGHTHTSRAEINASRMMSGREYWIEERQVNERAYRILGLPFGENAAYVAGTHVDPYSVALALTLQSMMDPAQIPHWMALAFGNDVDAYARFLVAQRISFEKGATWRQSIDSAVEALGPQQQGLFDAFKLGGSQRKIEVGPGAFIPSQEGRFVPPAVGLEQAVPTEDLSDPMAWMESIPRAEDVLDEETLAWLDQMMEQLPPDPFKERTRDAGRIVKPDRPEVSRFLWETAGHSHAARASGMDSMRSDSVSRFLQPEDFPAMVIAPVRKVNLPLGKWDQIVRFGFGRVLGPMIDKMVRTPMAFNAFARAYTDGERSLKWLRDPHYFASERLGTSNQYTWRHNWTQDKANLDDTIRALLHPDTPLAKDAARLSGGRVWMVDGEKVDEWVLANHANLLQQVREDPTSSGEILEEFLTSIVPTRHVLENPTYERGTLVKLSERLAGGGQRKTWFDLTPKDRALASQAIRDLGWGSGGMFVDEYDAFEAMMADKKNVLNLIQQRLLDVSVPADEQRRLSHLYSTISSSSPTTHTDGIMDELLDWWAEVEASHGNYVKGLLSQDRKIRDNSAKALKEMSPYEGLKTGDLFTIKGAWLNHSNTTAHLEKLATQRAILDVVPYIDRDSVRTQFSETARNLIPFWGAEDQFMRRWARIAVHTPEFVRKAQLTYMGMQHSGIVQTDEFGNDYFVYPGTSVLAEVVGKLPYFRSFAPLATGMTGQVKYSLPGLDRFGVPQVSPFIAVPLNEVAEVMPELKPYQQALAGARGSRMDIVRSIVPTQVMRFYDAILSDEDSNAQMASAMMQAAAVLEANGHGLRDGATLDEIQVHLDRLRSHARSILLSRAMFGFFAPAAPQAEILGRSGAMGSAWDFQNLLGFQTPEILLNQEYMTLVRNLGVEDGTQRFLEMYPDSTPEDLFNRNIAYRVGMSTRYEGAPIAATDAAWQFYSDNESWIRENPAAGAWLIPPASTSEEATARSAGVFYDQMAAGLRSRKTPEEFVKDLAYAAGSTTYFDTVRQFDDLIEGTTDPERRNFLGARKATWQSAFLAAHPIFAEINRTGAGVQRRARVLDAIRIAADDPLAPESRVSQGIYNMTKQFDRYTMAAKNITGSSRHDKERRENLRVQFLDWGDRQVAANPDLAAYWQGIIEPEVKGRQG